MKQKKHDNRHHDYLKLTGTDFYKTNIKQALTNSKQMCALRKIDCKFPNSLANSIEVRFNEASCVGKCGSVSVSSINKAFVRESVRTLRQKICAVAKLRRFVECDKKILGVVIGKGGKGIHAITRTVGSGTRIRCDNSKCGPIVTSFETLALGITHVNLDRHVKECFILRKTNKKRPRQNQILPPANRVFGSRYSIPVDEGLDDEADGNLQQTASVRQGKQKPHAGSITGHVLRQRAALQLFIYNSVGHTITLDVLPSASVTDVLSKIQIVFKQNSRQHRHGLFFGGTPLETGRRLSDYGVCNHATLQFLSLLRGGMKNASANPVGPTSPQS